MTKIYIYCLFDRIDGLHGVYSSIKAAHRDALRLCNKGNSQVYVKVGNENHNPSVTLLRNLFKGELDVKVEYTSDKNRVQIVKTKLRE